MKDFSVITALATPYRNGKVDAGSFEKLTLRLFGRTLLCCGTTAEGAFLTPQEKKTLVEIAKQTSPVWVGISAGVTDLAAKEGETAAKLGATGVLVCPPSFHKCTEQGFVKHVLAVKNACGLPIMLYNAPSRCGYVLWQSAVEKLAQAGCWIKDAGSDLSYAKQLSQKLPLFCGNDELLREFSRCGAVGAVSVVSNLFYDLVERVGQGYQSEIFQEIAKLAFAEINPVAIKYMLFRAGIFGSYEMRLPLTAASENTRRKIDEFWRKNAKKLQILLRGEK